METPFYRAFQQFITVYHIRGFLTSLFEKLEFVQESWASSEYWFRMCICLNMIITPITSKSPIIAIIVCLVSDVINTQRLCNSLVIVFQFNKIPPLSNVNNIKTNAIFLLHLSFINNSL